MKTRLKVTVRAKRIVRACLAAAVMLAACIMLSSCAPVLSLNPKYSYTSFELEIGQSIPTDIGEFVDMSGLSDEDRDFVVANTEILYDGEPVDDKVFDDAGDHSLSINYMGRQYRRYDITITDEEPPVFTRAENVYTFEGIPLADEDSDNMFDAEDNSGKVRIKVKKSDVDYYKAGKYKVTATATDKSGNKATAKAYVVVQAPEYGAKGTYVFVSIPNQTLTYFVDSEPVLECPVVTGNTYNGHSTPRGTFHLNYKSRNITLKGTEDNGDEYESFVSYWMAFIGSSYGLHDATWRGRFGGNIYQGAGSHGCVNMPYASAAELYEMIEPGTPVLIY